MAVFIGRSTRYVREYHSLKGLCMNNSENIHCGSQN